MKSSSLEDIISDDLRGRIVKYCEQESANFSSDVSGLGLNKAKDFVGTNLVGVSFTDADLRGFDFTGADLREATGKNVRWDETTILDHANVESSIFAYHAHKQKFFNSNPHWYSEFLRRRRGAWTHNTIWLADEMLRRSRDLAAITEVAKALFDDTSDNFLRSQILFFLAPTFDKRVDHRDFLLHTMAKYGAQPLIVRATIRTLATLFRDDRMVFDILLGEIFDDDESVRIAAMRGAITSKFLKTQVKEIGEKCKFFPADVRRYYVKRVAAIYGPVCIAAVSEPVGSSTIDFQEPITDAKIFAIARSTIIARKQLANFGRRQEGGMPMIAEASLRETEEQAVITRACIHKMRDSGVPFEFQGSKRASTGDKKL